MTSRQPSWIKLNRGVLALMVGRLIMLAIVPAEKTGDKPTLPREQADAVQNALEKTGIVFTVTGPRLRKDPT